MPNLNLSTLPITLASRRRLDKRYAKNEHSIQSVLHSALARRRLNLRARDIYQTANISAPTFYLHCHSADDALRSYEQHLFSDFRRHLPSSCTHHALFLYLLNFIYSHRDYFSATLVHGNAWLLIRIFQTLRPNLAPPDLDAKTYDHYMSALIGIIFCWGKHDHFCHKQLIHYATKMSQLRIHRLGL